jgi:serine/threonine protein kinase
VKICPACSREYSDEHDACRDDGVVLVRLDQGGNERAQDLIGKVVDGRYRIERIVGRGGMGTVYACRHVVVGKPFAMKVLRPGIERSEEILQRFIREAQAANAVQSRHICEMTDFGQLANGAFYVVMELLEGMSLTRALRESRLNRKNLKHIFIQIAETLNRAHKASIIHRDLKPDNVVLVTDEGDPNFVKLVDFGIAKMVQSKASNLTETGVILGTPYYMSPEQARGDELDHRSDIYALGVMMYRAFTGRLPFVADTAMGVLTRHLTEKPELPSRLTEIDPALERLILRCLEKKAIDRFQTMSDVADALRAVSDEVRRELLRATIDERSGAVPAVTAPPAAGAIPAIHSEEHPTPTRVATPMAKSLRRAHDDNRAQAASGPVPRSNPPPRPRSNPPPPLAPRPPGPAGTPRTPGPAGTPRTPVMPGMPVVPGPLPLPQVPASQRPLGPSAPPATDTGAHYARAKMTHPTPEHGLMTPAPMTTAGGTSGPAGGNWSSGTHPVPSGVHRVHEPIVAPPGVPHPGFRGDTPHPAQAGTPQPVGAYPGMQRPGYPLPPQVPASFAPPPGDGLPPYLQGEAATNRGLSTRISVRPQRGSRRLAVVGGVLVGLIFALGALAIGLYAMRTSQANAGGGESETAKSASAASAPPPRVEPAVASDETSTPPAPSTAPKASASTSAEPSSRGGRGKRGQPPPPPEPGEDPPSKDPVDDVRNPFD